MKNLWFKQLGWTYLPVHPLGWLVSIAAVVFLVPVFTAITRNGHSVSDNLYQMFVYTTCTAFWWKWIAGKTSEKNN